MNNNNNIINKNDRHEISFILSFKRITSVNEAYKAKVSYTSGKPVAQVYKSAETKEFQRRAAEQLERIDFRQEAPWIWDCKAFNLTFQVTLNSGFFQKDLDNTIKAFQDSLFRHLGLNDSKVIELHGWKSIMPDAPEELICVKLSESDYQYEIKGTTDKPKKDKPWKVFLGGTCSGDTWRDQLIPGLKKSKIKYFNPVVPDWTPECIEIEEKEKNEKCNILLYTITSKMKGPYSLAEVVDSAWKSKNGTDKKVLLYVSTEGFTEEQLHSLKATVDLVGRIGKNNIKAVIYSDTSKILDEILCLIS